MITVVLLRPQTPGNIGFIARAMKNFDLEKLILVDPKCSHLHDDALKTSKHAKSVLERAKVKKFSELNFDVIIGTTSVLGTDYNIPRTPLIPEVMAQKIKNENIALILGNEGTGLSNEEIKKCDFIVTIPSSKKYPALNISHAAVILFYEIYKVEGKNKIGDFTPASAKEKEIILKKFNNILDNLEFSTKEKKQTQKIVWKRILEKSMIRSYALCIKM